MRRRTSCRRNLCLLTSNVFLNYTSTILIWYPERVCDSSVEMDSPSSSFVDTDLATFCRRLCLRPLDLLVDNCNPDDPPQDSSTIVYLILQPDVDDIVADDILSLGSWEIDYLSALPSDYRTNTMVLRIDHSYYLALDSQRVTLFSKLAALKWKSGQSL